MTWTMVQVLASYRVVPGMCDLRRRLFRHHLPYCHYLHGRITYGHLMLRHPLWPPTTWITQRRHKRRSRSNMRAVWHLAV